MFLKNLNENKYKDKLNLAVLLSRFLSIIFLISTFNHPTLSNIQKLNISESKFGTYSNTTNQFSKSQLDLLLHKTSELDDDGQLPYIPPGISSVTDLERLHFGHKKHHKVQNITKSVVSSGLEEKIKLVHLTDTFLNCFILPPERSFINMDDLMGFWYMTRKVNSINLTDSKYACEEVIYIATGLNTFIKIADVHFDHKWTTIHGNGTFISPGILIIDWKILTKPYVADRLVYTILGTDYNHFVVGYDCRTGKLKPEVVLQTRSRRIKLKYLERAYAIIKDDDLPLDDLVCEYGL